MKKKLLSNWGLKLMSILLAFVLWIIVVNIDNPVEYKEFRNVKVQLLNELSLIHIWAKRSGYVRVRIDGSLYELSEEIRLDKNIKHNIDIVVDRLVVKEGIERRLTDSIENVLERCV